jgi:hypothetical protein
MPVTLFAPKPLLFLAALIASSAFAQTPEVPVAGQVISSAPSQPSIPPDAAPATPVTDADRNSIEITGLSLDLHLIPAQSREEARATLTLHNTTSAPLTRFPLQLSSTLHWLTASAPTASGLQPIPFTQSPIATDTDHTGYAQEAIFTPAKPLAPNATLTLSVFYAGPILRNADRLELIGVPHDQAAASDWDQVAPTSDIASTALRGFGNVLWYPVAAPTARLGDGNRLFTLIAREQRRNTTVAMRLRLTVEYLGDPPDSVLFNGQLQPLAQAPDGTDLVVDDTQGIASADFPAAPIGFRAPSLFLTAQRAVTTPDQLLTSITPRNAAPYAEAVASLQPLLAGLLGPTPRQPMLLLDHPGQPFADSSLLVDLLSPTADPKLIAPELVRTLTHAWLSPQSRPVPPSAIWIDQGLPEFVSLLWTERTQGREAAIAKLRSASTLIALADDGTQPLTRASSDTFLRLKAAFVFWQLREQLGDEALSNALKAFRHSLALNPTYDRDEKALQRAFETASKKDLAGFFDDWVYTDLGLPDLTIVSANPRALPARGGKSGGYLVAVEVRNDGEIAADVPITVRSGSLSATERLRIPPHASASTRIVFEGNPEVIEVNDGSTPELRTTTHTLQFTP